MIDLVTEIKEKISIMDLLTRLNIEVNRAGFVFSPYRNEKTASCMIYKDTNSFCDHADRKGGDVIEFYRAFYNIEVGTAIKELASMFNITGDNITPRELNRPAAVIKGKDPKDSMSEEELEYYNERSAIAGEGIALKDIKMKRLELNKDIFLELYCYCLKKGWDADAYDYLTKIRKLDPYFIEYFSLFSIKDYNEVNNHMKKTYNIKDLQRSGLYNTKENGDGNLIFYSHRIIIPYMWKRSIIYLRGRYFFERSAKVPIGVQSSKYLGLKNDNLNLNSPKRFFNSDFFITGLPGEKLYLVEGELDVIALEGLRRNTIGIPGAGNMPDEKQLEKLLKYDITIIGDDDIVGRELTTKLCSYFREKKKQIKLKKLPVKDVNDFIIKYSD